MTIHEIEALMLAMDEARRMDERGNLAEIFAEEDGEIKADASDFVPDASWDE